MSKGTLTREAAGIHEILGTENWFLIADLIRVSRYRDEFYAEFYGNRDDFCIAPPPWNR